MDINELRISIRRTEERVINSKFLNCIYSNRISCTKVKVVDEVIMDDEQIMVWQEEFLLVSQPIFHLSTFQIQAYSVSGTWVAKWSQGYSVTDTRSGEWHKKSDHKWKIRPKKTMTCEMQHKERKKKNEEAKEGGTSTSCTCNYVD